jgi:fatty acid desaturase
MSDPRTDGAEPEGTERAGEQFVAKARLGLRPDEVRALSQLSSPRATLSIARTLLLAAGCITLALATRGRPLHALAVAAAILGLAGAQHALAVLAHEAAHYRLYKARWLNDLAGRLCAAPLGLSMLTYRILHRIHHNHLYQPIDPDLPLMAGYPRGKLYLIRKLLKDLSGITIVKSYAYFVGRPAHYNRAAPAPLDDTSPSLRAAAARDRRMVLLVQLSLLALAIYFNVWRWYLLLWILPLITLLQAILRLRAVLEHGAVEDTSTPLKAARTNFVPLYLYWILFPLEVHYHIEHHLYPSIPHYRLARCHQMLRARGILDGAEVSTLPQALGKLFAPPRSPARPNATS